METGCHMQTWRDSQGGQSQQTWGVGGKERVAWIQMDREAVRVLAVSKY